MLRAVTVEQSLELQRPGLEAREERVDRAGVPQSPERDLGEGLEGPREEGPRGGPTLTTMVDDEGYDDGQAAPLRLVQQSPVPDALEIGEDAKGHQRVGLTLMLEEEIDVGALAIERGLEECVVVAHRS